MGSSLNTYIGPVIRIKLQEVTYTEDRKCCATIGCEYYHEETEYRFCRSCGEKIEDESVSEIGTLGWRDFQESTEYEYEDVLVSPEYLGEDDEDVLISNSTRDQGVTYLEDEGGIILLSELDPVQALAAFSTRHGGLLKKMESFFPPKLITIDFAVCSYWD